MTPEYPQEGDDVHGGKVSKRYYSGLGVETAVIDVGRRSANSVAIKEEMASNGWVYHFTRDETGKMFFRDSNNWNMEPGAGDS